MRLVLDRGANGKDCDRYMESGRKMPAPRQREYL